MYGGWGWRGGVGVGIGVRNMEGGEKQKCNNYKHEPSQNSCTQHIFVTIYISKQKDH